MKILLIIMAVFAVAGLIIILDKRNSRKLPDDDENF